MPQNKGKGWVWGIIVIVVIVLIVIFAGKSKTGAETIKIGYIGPFTGPVAGSSGETVANGWKLGVSDRPTIAGKKVEVIYEDDVCDPKKAAAAAQKLITIDKVQVLVNGVCSGSMLAAAPIAETNKVILFTPVSTSPKITDAGDYIFRTSGTGANIASVINERITKLGYKKIAFINENAEYPIGIRDSFIKSIDATLGQVIVAQESINSQDTDMRTQLTKIAQSKPDTIVVVMNSAVTANMFAKQSKELGLNKLPVFANEYFAFSDVVNNPDAEGINATLYKYDNTSTAFQEFMAKYEKVYSKKPGQELYAALPYDGYNVLANAIEKCGNTEPDCVRDELYKTANYAGLTGSITIDQNGDTARQSMIRKISGMKLIPTE